MIVIDLSAGQSVVGEPEKNTVSVITKARPKIFLYFTFEARAEAGVLKKPAWRCLPS